MKRKAEAHWAGLLLATAILIRTTRAADPVCYDTWGTENRDLVPCISDDSTKPTSCCSKGDYCLSNGLCLSTSVNNLMTQQGCTDKNWGQPCNRICGANNSNNQTSSSKPRRDQAHDHGELNIRNHPADDVGIALLPCVNSWNGQGGVRYCCGDEAIECCQSSKWMSIPPATLIGGNIPTSAPTQATVTNEPPKPSSPAADQTPAAPNPEPTTDSSASDQAESHALRVGVGVGLGIGIPILIMLIVMVVILLRQYKRQSAAADLAALPRTMTPFRMVDTRRSSTVGSLHRHMSTRTTRAGPPPGLEEWPPSNMEWGSPSTMSDRGVLLSPVLPLQRPLSPTPLAEMDGDERPQVSPVSVARSGGSTGAKPRVEQLELPLGADIE